MPFDTAFFREKHNEDSHLSTLLSAFDTENVFILTLWKSADRGLKNHYIISKEASINNDKNTYKKHVYNQQEIN